MVVDVVIYHWETLVAGEDVVPEGFRRGGQKLVTILYAEDGILASHQLASIQEALDIQTGLFERVGLQFF